MCTQQSRKVICDMINTLFLATVAVVNSKPPTILFGIVACTFPTTFLEIAVYN